MQCPELEISLLYLTISEGGSPQIVSLSASLKNLKVFTSPNPKFSCERQDSISSSLESSRTSFIVYNDLLHRKWPAVRVMISSSEIQGRRVIGSAPTISIITVSYSSNNQS